MQEFYRVYTRKSGKKVAVHETKSLLQARLRASALKTKSPAVFITKFTLEDIAIN